MANICFTRLCITLSLRVLQLFQVEDILDSVSDFSNPDIDNRVDERGSSVCWHAHLQGLTTKTQSERTEVSMQV